METSYIYFEGQTNEVRVKIGKTKRNPEIRIKEQQTGNSKELKLWMQTKKFSEKELKARFKAYKTGTGGNEWFLIDLEKLVEFQKEIMGEEIINETQPEVRDTSSRTTASTVSRASFKTDFAEFLDLHQDPDGVYLSTNDAETLFKNYLEELGRKKPSDSYIKTLFRQKFPNKEKIEEINCYSDLLINKVFLESK
jgi:hypothetical protein